MNKSISICKVQVLSIGTEIIFTISTFINVPFLICLYPFEVVAVSVLAEEWVWFLFHSPDAVISHCLIHFQIFPDLVASLIFYLVPANRLHVQINEINLSVLLKLL